MRTITLVAVFTFAVTISAGAQAGSGAKYGSRDPKPCPAANFGGPPSTAQAGQLFTCATEKDTGDTIYLVGNVQVQVATSSRAFQAGDTYNDIDPHKPIYPIRGSFTYYSCRKQYNIDASHTNVGKNCSILQQPHAQGICYKTTFSDWTCKMTDPTMHWDQATTGNPPPR